MRKVLLIVPIVFVAMGFSSAGGVNQPLKPTCTISNITLNAAKTTATAAGNCKVAGKKVSVRWSSSVQTYDDGGYACGLAPVKAAGILARLQPAGAHSLRVAFTITTRQKVNGRFVSTSRSQKFGLGDTRLACGRIGRETLPSPAALCDWGAYPSGNCGDASQTPVAWLTSITFSNGVIRAGRIASPSGLCQRVRYDPTPKKYFWLGSEVVPEKWQCTGGLSVFVTLYIVQMDRPQGDYSCVGQPTAGGRFLSFTVPAHWGGKLYVGYLLEVVIPTKQVGYEYSRAIFLLPGTQDGCPELWASRGG